MTRALAVFALFALFAPRSAGAAVDPKAAAKMVRGSVDEALKVLEDPALKGKKHRKARWAKLRGITDKAFDWRKMSQRSLGVHWRKLDEAERTRFAETFVELLAGNYLGQIDRFTGKEKVEFVGTDKGPEGVEVKMKIVTASREEVPIHFFVDEREKVYDVSIEGVSIANHYRGSFDRLFVNNDFDTLMKKLERKIAFMEKKADEGGAE